MQDNTSLGELAFGRHAKSGLIVAYQSHQDALRFLSTSLERPNGVALLQGPVGSGKSTIIHEQLSWASRDSAVAMFDGAHLTPRQLLTGMLSQFDVAFNSQHDEQLLQYLNSFLTKETREGRSAVLMIDNADRATPSALRLLNWLAALEAGQQYALRIVLTGKDRLTSLLSSDSMRNLTRRHPLAYTLNALTPQEAIIYLRTRHIAAGGESSEKVFSMELCEKLHALSNGWPGGLNRCALKAMQRRAELQSVTLIPRITVSRDGHVIAVHELTKPQHLIGRADLADIVIEDSYVSKMHAMLQVYSNAIMLLDLNSTNGTTVNSRIVEKSILRNDDVITLGHYRLKLDNAPALDRDMDEKIRASDTLTMLNLEDMRRSRARRTIKALKHK